MQKIALSQGILILLWMLETHAMPLCKSKEELIQMIDNSLEYAMERIIIRISSRRSRRRSKRGEEEKEKEIKILSCWCSCQGQSIDTMFFLLMPPSNLQYILCM